MRIDLFLSFLFSRLPNKENTPHFHFSPSKSLYQTAPRGSEGRKIKFWQCVVQTSLESKKGLHQDVPTRWNSTYTMLSSALYYRRALCYFNLCDSNYVSCPTDEEWTRVEKISGFLGGFYEATNSFSGSLYPTSNLYFPHVFYIQLHLVEKSKSPDQYMKKIAQQMLKKFGKYWSKFNLLLAIAVVFKIVRYWSCL